MDGTLISHFGFFVIIPILLLTLIFFSWYYFIYLPKKSALVTFWKCFSIGMGIGILLPLVIILTRYTFFIDTAGQGTISPEVGKSGFALFLAIAGLLSQIEIFIIVYFIFMIFYFTIRNKSTIHWGIKAMRRYPFTFNKIKKSED